MKCKIYIKKISYLLLVIALFSCDSEDANDCFQNAGHITQQEVSVTDFSKILVTRDIELVITEAVNYSVIVETGENLHNDVTVEVVGNELQLTDANNCNFVRDYGITKIYVTAPNITHIRSATQYDISSNGVLNYPVLNLISEDFNNPGTFAVGDFRMQLQADNVRVVANNLSFFYLSGTTTNLSVKFFSGDGRFEGGNLIAQDIDVYHRGSNDMIVNPYYLPR